MPLEDAIEKLDKAYGNGKLEKASFVLYNTSGNVVGKPIEVQFNPSEYSISRATRLSSKRPLGQGIHTPNAVNSDESTLSVSLYFDSYTQLKAGQGMVNQLKNTYLPSSDMNEELSPKADAKVNALCDKIISLIKYAHTEHQPPKVAFIWGDTLHFEGIISSHTVQYTVFDRDGTPVRAKLTLAITGEERDYAFRKKANPNESPDRTKQRTLHYGDTLWMMAQEEYGDVAYWKTIAAANGILNPRAIRGVARLKVPSIR